MQKSDKPILTIETNGARAALALWRRESEASEYFMAESGKELGLSQSLFLLSTNSLMNAIISVK